ncbi:hypothetical protein OEA41_006934 [Lepraria neglecta]|uniref:Uncharacterized protein n=1 Tax=Lepraria neglecta TaxID=209136 RepID=A0AAD9ZC47_9LECA|nr:hypothetical protein OEA41_006934 [Lepraria neglecta]
MAEYTVQSVTNSELLELNRRKKAKASRVQGNYGAARKKEKERSQEIRRLNILGPELFAPPRPPATPRRRAPAAPPSPPAALLSPISPPERRQKKIVILRLRVTTQDLQQGRLAEGWEQGKHMQQGPGELKDQLMGRGQRVRKPRKAE